MASMLYFFKTQMTLVVHAAIHISKFVIDGLIVAIGGFNFVKRLSMIVWIIFKVIFVIIFATQTCYTNSAKGNLDYLKIN